MGKDPDWSRHKLEAAEVSPVYQRDYGGRSGHKAHLRAYRSDKQSFSSFQQILWRVEVLPVLYSSFSSLIPCWPLFVPAGDGLYPGLDPVSFMVCTSILKVGF